MQHWRARLSNRRNCIEGNPGQYRPGRLLLVYLVISVVPTTSAISTGQPYMISRHLLPALHSSMKPSMMMPDLKMAINR